MGIVTNYNIFPILSFVVFDSNESSFCKLEIINGKMDFHAGRLLAQSPRLKEIRSAEAFIVNSTLIKLVISMYLKPNDTGCPSKVFKKEDEAIDWLMQFTDKPAPQ